MKPAMIMAGALWIMTALCVSIAVMGRDHLGAPGLALIAAVAVYMMAMAIRFTRCWRQGNSDPLIAEDRVRDLRRRRSHGRFIGHPH